MCIFCYRIEIGGRVQGVGFRPFIYRLAVDMAMCGSVHNSKRGVQILCHTTPEKLAVFLRRLRCEAPPAASIEHIDTVPVKPVDVHIPAGFTIEKSDYDGLGATQICPDIAICADCLADLRQQPRRIDYPFTNCTNCGPRYTITRSLPYDRGNTTMQPFKMCSDCEGEYRQPLDRRFHAQPIACNHCGPRYMAHIGSETFSDYRCLLQRTIELLTDGGVVALKGMGGYNLLCDADNREAVARIRALKGRYHKPLAVMYPSVEVARRDVLIDADEEALLTSWRRPVVLLRARCDNTPWLNAGYHTLGVLLPYMAIHYSLLSSDNCLKRIVFTSCNATHTPILYDDDAASQFCHGKVDAFITYNRRIYNFVDDSVAQIVCSKPLILRRSRGYVPESIAMDTCCDGVWACGAQEIAQFAIGVGTGGVLSPYIGSHSYYENRMAYDNLFQLYRRLYDFKPRLRVVDLHPHYYTHSQTDEEAETRPMQHHHAHAVACMVEHRLHDELMALCVDGTGYGSDGRIWGGVLMRCNRVGYRVLRHIPFIDLPGGDQAAKQCWVSAAGWLRKYGITPPQPWVKRVGEKRVELYNRMADSRRTVEWSSTGRLFDAVASLLGIADSNRYSGEAPQLLEQEALFGTPVELSIPFLWDEQWTCLIRYICNSVTNGEAPAVVAATFHHAFASIWCEEIVRQAAVEHLHEILLTGGAMQNRLLTQLLHDKLTAAGLTVYLHSLVPCNDAGIAIGQLAYGAALLSQNRDETNRRQ